MIETSICLIETASPSRISSTHAASHGAGHSLPVNSGKLLVACSWSIASRQRSRYTRSFQSGIRLPSGQPLWQNGTPHSMQRAPWSRSPSTGSVLDELAVVAGPLRRVALRLADALDLEEGAELAHYAARSVATKPSPPVDSPSSIECASASASSASARL